MQKIADEKPFYEKLSQKKLSDEEVLEAKQNFVGFFDLRMVSFKGENRDKFSKRVELE